MDNINNDNLQTALSHFNVFYLNVLEQKKQLKNDNKKLPWSFIFKKSEDPVFNGIASTLLCLTTTATCFTLHNFEMLPFDPYIGSLAISAGANAAMILINNGLYHLNNSLGGNIGRTYAKMQGDFYYECIEYFVKKNHKNLLCNTATLEQKKEDLIGFCTTLDNLSSNMQYRYNKLCERVKKYNEKEQIKWKPVLEHIKEHNEYLLNNAKKFNFYAEQLQNENDVNLEETSTNLEEFDASKDKEHSSEFSQFKKYLESKIRKDRVTKKSDEDDEFVL